MYRILLVALDALTAAVLLIPIIIIIQLIFCKDQSFLRKLSVNIFAFYIAAVFDAVGIPALSHLTFDLNLNLIPLIDVFNSPVSYLRNSFLNILLFIPLGFFAPFLWKTFRSFKNMVLLGFGFSFFIEIIQMFTWRVTDIDDLITNTAGAIIGFGAAKFLIKCKNINNTKNPFKISELLFIFLLAFAVKFFAQPYISEFIWSFIN